VSGVVPDRVYHDVRSGSGEVVNGVIVEDLILIFLSVCCDNIHEVTGLALNNIGRKHTVNESPLLPPLSVTCFKGGNQFHSNQYKDLQ